MKTILIAMNMEEKDLERLRKIAPDCRIAYKGWNDVTEEEVSEASVIIGNVPAGMIHASKKLELLQLFSAGADPYLASGTLAESTVLCNATGAYGQAVSEHAFALTVMLIKKLHLYRSSQMRKTWEDHGMVTSLADATVLVVGLGDIGLCYARQVKALGARVIGVKRRAGDCPDGVDELVLTEDIDTVLPRADVVMSVLPSTKDTVHFFTAERFALMKNSAVFINCGRGNAVAGDVLLHALRSGQIASAAVDVTETEPLPADSPLWEQENLMITPHVAGNFHMVSTYEGIVDIALRNVNHWQKGESLENIVDMQTGYKR